MKLEILVLFVVLSIPESCLDLNLFGITVCKINTFLKECRNQSRNSRSLCCICVSLYLQQHSVAGHGLVHQKISEEHHEFFSHACASWLLTTLRSGLYWARIIVMSDHTQKPSRKIHFLDLGQWCLCDHWMPRRCVCVIHTSVRRLLCSYSLLWHDVMFGILWTAFGFTLGSL